MEKKRSVGIAILSVALLLTGIFGVFRILNWRYDIYDMVGDINQSLFIVLSIGVFTLKEWARKLSVVLSWVSITSSL